MVYLQQRQQNWWNTCRNDIDVISCVNAINSRARIPAEFCDQTDLAKQNLFLDNITTGLSDQQKNNLQVDLSEQIEAAISQMANGKTPGHDGLSIEFYTHCWPIVKHEVICVLREMFSSQSVEPQIRTDYLTLIHKKGPKNEISNYRPISLLNYDLKIFTKPFKNPLFPTLLRNNNMPNQENKFPQLRLCLEICGGMYALVKLMHTSSP